MKEHLERSVAGCWGVFVADAFWLEFEVFSSQSGPSGLRGPSGPSSGGKGAKFEKLRNILMAAGLVQGGQEGQVVFEAPTGLGVRNRDEESDQE